MPFGEKLAKLRKDKGLTQEELAKKIGVGIAQMRRYEGGGSSPTLGVIQNITRTLGISADELIFDEHEGVASAKLFDKKLLEQFERLSKMNSHDQEAIKTILESMILKSRLEEVLPLRTDTTWSNEMRRTLSTLRKGAEGYSEEEIDHIVNEAVIAVRGEKKLRREKVGA